MKGHFKTLTIVLYAGLYSFAFAQNAPTPINEDTVWIHGANQSAALDSTGNEVNPRSVHLHGGETIPGYIEPTDSLLEDEGIQVGNRLYEIGGQGTAVGGFTCTRDFFYYDMVKDQWYTCPDLALGISHAATTLDPDGKTIWVLGGYFETSSVRPPPPATPTSVSRSKSYSTTRVMKYDTVTGTWTSSDDPGSSIPPLPQPRAAGSAIFQGHILHFIGGADGGRNDAGGLPLIPGENPNRVSGGSDHFFLDTTNLKAGWQTDPVNLTFPRDHVETVLFNNKLWVVAGQQGHDNSVKYYTRVDSYDATTDTWSRENDLNFPGRSHCYDATIITDGRIFVAGGFGSSDINANYQASTFDPNPIDPTTGIKGIWSPLPILPGGDQFSVAGWYNHTTIVVSGSVGYAIIGVNLKGPSNLVTTTDRGPAFGPRGV